MKLLLIVLSAAVALAQTPTARPNPNADPETIPLWENGTPGALGNADTDHPTLIIFRGASRPNGGTSVIISARRRLHQLSDRQVGASDRLLVQRYWRYGVCVEVPARAALSPSDRARECSASHPSSPLASGAVRHRIE
jgi:hypothetical protein